MPASPVDSPNATADLPATPAERVAASLQLAELSKRLTAATAENERLRRDLQLRNAALDVATSHFMIIDAQTAGRPIVYVNHSLARDHGYEPAELIGRNINTLTLKYKSGEDLDRLRRAIETGSTIGPRSRGHASGWIAFLGRLSRRAAA